MEVNKKMHHMHVMRRALYVTGPLTMTEGYRTNW